MFHLLDFPTRAHPLDALIQREQSNALTKPHTDAFALMKVDFVEHDTHYAFHADMPGFKKEDINITCHDGVLEINGERSSDVTKDEETPEGVTHYRERSSGSVKRTFRLPPDAVKEDSPMASYVDGVLSIKFDKAAAVENKTKIRIA